MSDKQVEEGTAQANAQRHAVRVQAIEPLAQGVCKLTLVQPEGKPLIGFAPGAHIDVHLPNGLVRAYSLISDATDAAAGRYELAIGLDANSRGGSRFVHTELKAAATLEVSAPRNHFPLADSSDPVLLIAGGIGVTPIRAMLRELQRRGTPWQLVYAARSRASAAFVDEFAACGDAVHWHFDDERGGPLDVAAALAQAPAHAHIYCCGPAGLMDRVKTLSSDRDSQRVHFEWFQAPAQTQATEGPQAFTLKLARRGLELQVPAQSSILDVLEAHDVIIPSVCKEGVCGTCECRILSGEADHRDVVLTDAERAANEVLMVCVSRAKGDCLVLDL
jgi:ferredoxin-NADP reductase